MSEEAKIGEYKVGEYKTKKKKRKFPVPGAKEVYSRAWTLYGETEDERIVEATTEVVEALGKRYPKYSLQSWKNWRGGREPNEVITMFRYLLDAREAFAGDPIVFPKRATKRLWDVLVDVMEEQK